MDSALVARYQGFVHLIEEPVRDIVRALWTLPFVEDTGHSCSGHGLALWNDAFRQGEEWYPHRATLEIFYSKEPEHIPARERLREALKGVRIEYQGRVLDFAEGTWAYERMPGAMPFIKKPLLWERYETATPDGPETIEHLVETEELLTRFWEDVANVIRPFTPSVDIGPIRGKDFRKVVDWDYWQNCFPEAFLR